MMQTDTQKDPKVKGKYRKLTKEELDNIWAHRFQKQKDIAEYHKIDRSQVKRILARLKREREATQLSKEEILQIAKATPKVKTELVTELVETKMEAMKVESLYKTAQLETQNALHTAIQEDIIKSRVVAQQSTDIAMQSLQKAIASLDHTDPMAVGSILASYEKLINAQQKHMNTLMKVGERYGIVDQTPKTPLVDQSTHNHNQSNNMVMMNLPAPLTDDDISKMNDKAYNYAVETEICR